MFLRTLDQILGYDCLPILVRWGLLGHSGLPALSRKKTVFKHHSTGGLLDNKISTSQLLLSHNVN